MVNETITLKSGREVRLFPLTFLQKQEVKEWAAKSAVNGTVALVGYTIAVKHAARISYDELEEFTDNEIIEAGEKVLALNFRTDEQKKSSS